MIEAAPDLVEGSFVVQPPASAESGWANLLEEKPPDESIPNRGAKQQPKTVGISDRARADSAADDRAGTEPAAAAVAERLVGGRSPVVLHIGRGGRNGFKRVQTAVWIGKGPAIRPSIRG